ncbi:MAG: hypothetical protein A2942_00565 [Candidatus Lloydbacteria bacterium RIFCSPLOWO2_01_FULL_50_20]|uniref:Metallo-beta-lactamase domain-containing protein n=1 Tax=Candidatus Lloydbacteria bacterium RIFCSPLOWO2_01_FULL_50_20 TaxID=1798665 RepID=A0A1G2DCX4_9BACT|nr:MAG: hypothetical protein A3C13_02075 [Candidatus Lloydbacteria bacterium RIFCSPHIGHO2_02_FULL_50_11]OGZ11272.1 MAG: hypothetical protein A2942_00565 [Candidatus Lloydbacteria bacterium RIFCSPLOWO2_01_FULL_50_20]
MDHRGLFQWAKRHPLFLSLLLLFVVDFFILTAYLERKHSVLTVVFLDVGQGDAVFVEAPNGNQLLYDAGPPTGAVLRALSEVMPRWDRSIDVVVLSHPDQDHIGGLLDMFDRYAFDVVVESGASSTNGVWAEAENEIVKRNIAHFVAQKGMMIDLGGGVQADILYPDHDTTNIETNSASIIMRIRYGETSFLLSGDLPKNIEDYAVTVHGDQLEAQVLKLGHHGSRTSSSETWLRTVKPGVAIISAGADNRYGHPHVEVLEMLDRLRIPYFITFNEGLIRFESNGKMVKRE